MLAQLRAYHEGLAGALSALGRGSAELKKEVAEISQWLAAMVERSRNLESLEQALASIAARARAAAGPPSRNPHPVREKSHHHRYTMAAERATLERMGNGNIPKDSVESAEKGLAEGSVEFF
jgi:hypothetical protein